MRRILTRERDVTAASRRLLSTLRLGERLHRIIGFQGGSGDFEIYWHETVGIWGTQVRFDNRYWHAFGLQDPHEHSGNLSVSVEINPPRRGIDRTIGGIFLEERSDIYLGHRGNKINQVPKDDFRRLFQTGRAGRWVRADDDDQSTQVLIVGRLDDSRLMTRIAAFAREVQRIKGAVRG